MGKRKEISRLGAWAFGALLLMILVFLSLLSLRIGSAGYSLQEIVDALFGNGSQTVRNILIHLRLPRVIVAIIVGACLATAGALLQAVMRNPLADPGIIGVSAGAGTAATAIMLLFPNLTTSVPIFAFAGSLLSCVLIYLMAYDGTMNPVRIVLAGVAINTVLGGFNALLQMLYSDSLSGVLSFLNGSIAASTWSKVRLILFYGLPCLCLSFLTIRGANALQLGDEMATNLGFPVTITRILISALAAFLSAATVAVVGLIGFVGLVVPHISRIIVGSDYRRLLPIGMIMGAVTALAADTIGRVAIQGMELPLGIVMSVAGGPFFLYLLKSRGKVLSGRK
ncbi:iron ABC transporter permease [Murdochiella sp. Marseille-P8839]|uniref:FecCD family ABC transporter permease n=1 Tax=Murdochiella vaginalis TaxID=1852373 RepID=UPI0008FE9FDB|nr:iron ABC transporter permease [Murdochiella vaginalis]MBY0584240.1 iron ABC transporter permease [Murdochiella sp. Marseille-P8839]